MPLFDEHLLNSKYRFQVWSDISVVLLAPSAAIWRTYAQIEISVSGLKRRFRCSCSLHVPLFDEHMLKFKISVSGLKRQFGALVRSCAVFWRTYAQLKYRFQVWSDILECSCWLQVPLFDEHMLKLKYRFQVWSDILVLLFAPCAVIWRTFAQFKISVSGLKRHFGALAGSKCRYLTNICSNWNIGFRSEATFWCSCWLHVPLFDEHLLNSKYRFQVWSDILVVLLAPSAAIWRTYAQLEISVSGLKRHFGALARSMCRHLTNICSIRNIGFRSEATF